MTDRTIDTSELASMYNLVDKLGDTNPHTWFRDYRVDRLQAAAFDTWFGTSMLPRKSTASRSSSDCIKKISAPLGIRVGFRMMVVKSALSGLPLNK